MKFISFKTDGGRIKGKISFYCKALEVSREAFYNWLERSNEPWKYEQLAKEMQKIHDEDKYNDCYGRQRMYQALMQKKASGKISIDIPCEATIRKVMDQIGLVHKPKRKPNGITKADREAMKSDDLLKRDFQAEKPLEKAVTDISELKAKDGKVYVSVVFDCFDLMPLGLAIEDNMKLSILLDTFLPKNFKQLCSFVHNRVFVLQPVEIRRLQNIFVCLSNNSCNTAKSLFSILQSYNFPICRFCCRTFLLSFLPTYFRTVHCHDIFHRHCSYFERDRIFV